MKNLTTRMAVPMCLTLSVVLSACASMPRLNPSKVDAIDMQRVVGTWIGNYSCRQGFTNVKVVLRTQTTGAVSGTLAFSVPPNNTAAVINGSFTVKAEQEGNKLVLKSGEWITKPANYYLVDLRGSLNAGSTVYQGEVCGQPFILQKAPDNSKPEQAYQKQKPVVTNNLPTAKTLKDFTGTVCKSINSVVVSAVKQNPQYKIWYLETKFDGGKFADVMDITLAEIKKFKIEAGKTRVCLDSIPDNY